MINGINIQCNNEDTVAGSLCGPQLGSIFGLQTENSLVTITQSRDFKENGFSEEVLNLILTSDQ